MALPLKLRFLPDEGGGDPAEFLLTDADCIVGRDPACDVVVDNPTVSSRHALLRVEGEGWTLLDLGSRNGSALRRPGADIAPVEAGCPVPVGPGDELLLGASDRPAVIRLETGAHAYGGANAPTRTVLASAPLADLLLRPPDALMELAARSIAAAEPDDLAAAALGYLEQVFPHASGRAVLLMGSGFVARAGDEPPGGLVQAAQSRGDAVIFQEAGEPLPMTESIAREGIGAAAVAPLLAAGGWHGALAAWSPVGPAALPAQALAHLSVAASLCALSCGALAVRGEGARVRADLEAEIRRLQARGPGSGAAVVEPIGSAPAFLEALNLCRAVAPSNVSVLLLGETGTGKEVLARAIHRGSRRADRPFVACNCAAVPESLLESELFGHVRGAFTGAASDRKGLFVEANGGTVFLDEIGEMPAVMQAKLLRVLQDGEVRPVGANRVVRVDVRVISATHRDLWKCVEEGSFRADVMYRLNAVAVRIPPLRERGDDIVLLAHALLGRACRRAEKRIPAFRADALGKLRAHDFPGNVRELENEIVRAVALTPEGEPIGPAAFSPAVAGLEAAPAAPAAPASGATTLREAVEAAERRAVEAALEAAGSMSRAAKVLGMTRPGLYKLMDRLGLR